MQLTENVMATEAICESCSLVGGLHRVHCFAPVLRPLLQDLLRADLVLWTARHQSERLTLPPEGRARGERESWLSTACKERFHWSPEISPFWGERSKTSGFCRKLGHKNESYESENYKLVTHVRRNDASLYCDCFSQIYLFFFKSTVLNAAPN